jgi:putative transcriptional regulator
MSESLRGQLLIASPALSDYFRRTVVLVIEHTEEGAFGLVLNRQAEANVSEAVPVLSELTGNDLAVNVGGPVAPDSVVVLGWFADPTDAAAPVVGDVGLLDPHEPDADLRDVRVYAGHAGWGPGQLDDELEQDAWIVEEAEPADPFEDGDLWARVLQRKGGAYALLATMPADPSQN